MKVICTKFEAASRKLDEAITLFFSDRDPLAVRTLAAAAHGLFADLVEHKHPNGSWRSHLIETSGLSKKDALEVINRAQNFLKHADRDPYAYLSFDEEENEYVIFTASLECGELGGPSSTAMQAFQIWYLAMYPDKIGAESELVITSRSAFPSLDKLTREEQLAAGQTFLTSVIA